MGLLTDASSYRDWNPSIVSLDGEITPGGKIALVSTVNPKRTFKLKVTEMTTPTRMVWSDGMPLGLFKGERTYRLVERIGSTEFSMTEDFTGPLTTQYLEEADQLCDRLAIIDGGLIVREGSPAALKADLRTRTGLAAEMLALSVRMTSTTTTDPPETPMTAQGARNRWTARSPPR